MSSGREEKDVVTVRTLLGEEQVRIARKCLNSLCKQVKGSVSLVIHDDGSLQQESIDRLNRDLPVERVLRRPEADEKMLQALSSYPNCREYRERSNFALKLFDVPVLADEDRVVFSDSDIFFARPVEKMFDLSGESAKFCSNGHMGNAYAVSFSQVTPLGKIRLVDSLNSGLFSLDAAYYDLAFIESVLEYLAEGKRYWERPYWAEQTCWSAVAAKIGAKLWRFEDVSIPMKKDEAIHIPSDALVLHFASSVRQALWDVDLKTEVEAREPQTIDPRYNTSLRQLKFDVNIYKESVLSSFFGG